MEPTPIPFDVFQHQVVGLIVAGHPANEACDVIDPGELRLPKSTTMFALKVRGVSMINAGIRDGDICIFEFKEPRNGDIVAALIDGENTLKRYIVQRGRPYLKAENPRFPDLIPAQELLIQGVQVALVRFSS